MHDVDEKLCTHVVVTSDPESRLHNLLLIHAGGVVDQKLVRLREKSSQFKLLISLNQEDLEPFKKKNELLPNITDIVAEEVVTFLQKYKFDGVVLNFFPTEDETYNYMNLTNSMIEALKPHGLLLVIYGADEYDRPEPEITDGNS